MAGVLPPTLPPDVRLGILLVSAVLLFQAGRSTDLWSLLASAPFDFSDLQFGLLSAAFGLGSLLVVGAAFWLDRHPPHFLMVAGALLLALGVVVLHVSHSFGLAAVGMFLFGAGGAFTGSLVFYSVAVKGSFRFRGALIGALGLALTLRWGDLGDLAFALKWGDWASSDQAPGVSAWLWPVGLVLAGGILLFLLLPRWSRGTYGPGPSLREVIAVPGANVRLAWVTGVYLVAAMVLAAGSTHLRWVTLAMLPDGAELDFGFRALALAGGVGALLWGIASDFFPVCRLLVILAVLSLPALGWSWAFDDPEGGALLLALVRGGLISLSWVLMAEVLPERHFAKLALAVMLVGLLGSGLGPVYWGFALDLWGAGSFFWIVLAETVALAGLVALGPGRSPVSRRMCPPPAQ